MLIHCSAVYEVLGVWVEPVRESSMDSNCIPEIGKDMGWINQQPPPILLIRLYPLSSTNHTQNKTTKQEKNTEVFLLMLKHVTVPSER